jgi:hypothetical protein
MRVQLYLLLAIIAVAGLVTACSNVASTSGDKTIKSTKSGEMTVSLANPSGELKSGDGDLIVIFTDGSGVPVDVGAASLNFHMAGMGTMPEMNNRAALTTTETPGRYRAQVNIEMAGTWEAQVAYEGTHGKGQANMTVNVR